MVFNNSNGAIKAFGFQHVGFPFPAVAGFALVNSSCVTLDTICQESLQPVILDGATFNEIRVTAKRQGSAAASAAAVTLKNTSTRNEIRSTITGKVGAFTCGVEMVGAGNGYNEVCGTRINPAATTSGYKFVNNGAAVTVPGTGGNAGTNAATGVMA